MVTPVKKVHRTQGHLPFLELCLGRLLCYKGLILFSSKPVPVGRLRTVILNILIGKGMATGNRIKNKNWRQVITNVLHPENYVKNDSFDPTDYTVHGILQERMLEWVAFLFSRGSSQPRD